MEYLKDTYDFSDSDIDYIISQYGLDYKDRSIVCCVYNDYYELGEEYADNTGLFDSCGINKGIFEKFFDYDGFGECLNEDEYYLVLEDGRIVYYSY